MFFYGSSIGEADFTPEMRGMFPYQVSTNFYYGCL